MTRFILFEICRANLKEDYSYLIHVEAMKSGILKIISTPKKFAKQNVNKFHKQTCTGKTAVIWYRVYLNGLKLKQNQEYIFLFHDGHPAIENLQFIHWLKKKYKAKCVLIVRNRIPNKKHPAIGNIDLHVLKENFDLVVTDEQIDARLYNLLFMPDPFSTITKRKMKIKYDICFLGVDKGRAKMVSEIAKAAKKNNIDYDFRIVDGGKRKYSELTYVEWQPYLNMLKQDMQSNCILEVLQPGQESCTLRLQEAVCLNKKLLTNNVKIKDEKYYNSQYIQIFESIEKIDWRFVQERIPVNYGYEGEYSPISFLNRIKQELVGRR